jgi:FkbM family methyltransferase
MELLDARLLARIERYRPAEAYVGASEPLIEQFYRHLLKHGDTVVDIGVHYGIHLFPMSETVGSAGRVIGIEASRERFDHMSSEILRRERTNITLLNVAASNYTGTTSFHLNKTQSGRSGIIDNRLDNAEVVEVVELQCDKLDNIIANVERVDFIKIDVENAEPLVLIGGARTLRRYNPIVIFEGNLVTSLQRLELPLSDLKDALFGFAIFGMFGNEIDFDHWQGKGGWNFLLVQREPQRIEACGRALSSAWETLLDSARNA